MPDCGYLWWPSSDEDRRQHQPGVNRGKGRGVTKPRVRSRRKKR